MGCSAAIALKRRGFAGTIRGCDTHPAHSETALRRGIVDAVDTLETVVETADLVIVAVPVDAAVLLLPRILDRVKRQTVTDFCSTKAQLAAAVERHPRRPRYVGSHPMAGAETSGPRAARQHLFDGKTAVLCDPERCDPGALEATTAMYRSLGMRILRMDSEEHDRQTAGISHLPHALAYALALTVLGEQDRSPGMRRLAGGGFDSVARLAKSPPEVWTPIFLSNAGFLSRKIRDCIEHLEQLDTAIRRRDAALVTRLIETANRIGDP